MRTSSFVSSVVTAAILGACTRALVLPNQPDLTPLARAYDAPDGVLDAAEAEQIAQDAKPRLEDVRQIDAKSYFGPAVDAVERGFSTKGIPTEGSDTIKVDAVGVATKPCPGFADASEPGSIRLTMVVRESRVDHVTSGHAEGCKAELEVAGRHVRISYTGDFDVYATSFASPDVESVPWLASIRGDLTIDDRKLPLEFDFLASSRGVAVRIPWTNGTHVVAALTNDGRIAIHAANGTFVTAQIAH